MDFTFNYTDTRELFEIGYSAALCAGGDLLTT